MAGVNELQVAVLIENPEKQRGVAADLGVLAQETIDVIENARRIGAESHAGKRALEHGRKQRGAEPFSGNVGDEKSSPVIVEREDVEVVATDRGTREIDAGDGEVGVIGEIAREERLLNVARDVDLLLQALAFALVFDEAGVVQDAGGVGGQGVNNLAIEFREGGRAARIQIENTQEIAELDVDHRFLCFRARDGVKRNDDHRPKALRDDTVRGLQILVGLREILGHDWRMLLERQLDGGLAGCETFRRKAESAAAAREPHLQSSGGVGFQQQPAVRVGDRHGMIQHRAENGIERKLRMKKSGGFEEKVQLAEPSAGRLGTGDVLDAGEQAWNGFVLGRAGGTEDDFIRVLEAETEDIAVVELAAFHFFAVDEKAAALATILNIVKIGFDDDRSTVARDAAVGELQVVAGFGASADQKRGLRDAEVAARAIRGDDFENGFTGCRNGIGHEPLETGL